MTVLTLTNISKAIRGVPILSGIDLTLRKGEKVGLVGRNGCGKTTLLRILAGTAEPDTGDRSVTGARSFGFISQEEQFEGLTSVIDAASQGQTEIRAIERRLAEIDARIEAIAGESDARIEAISGESAHDGSEELDRLVRRQSDLQEEYALRGGYLGTSRVEAVLSGLGFGREHFTARPDTLSGGESKRLQIARLLLGGHDVLLLDEPGNHLDINGCEWLTRHLREFAGTLIVVSHDRYLLNAVSDRIAELEGGRLRTYTGNYDKYVESRVEDREAEQKAVDQRRRLVEKEKDLIRRTHYGMKSRQAKSRAKKLERLEPVEEVAGIPRPHFGFAEVKPSGESVLIVEGAGAAVGDRSLYSGIDLALERGKVLGVIGPNGSGKSTFLKTLLDRLPVSEGGKRAIRTEGEVRLSPTANWVYFDQALGELDGSGTVLEELRTVAPAATDGELRSHLACYLIRGDDVHKSVRNLSGGEKSRVLLAKIALSGASLLILDEPTNHLDIFTREALEEAIRAYTGTVIMVTHDRRLLDQTADLVLLLSGAQSRLFHGNYSGLMAETAAAAARETEARSEVEGGAGRAASKRKAADRKHKPAGDRVKRRHTFDELEALIMAKETRVREIEKDFYSEEVYTDADLYRKLEAEAAELRAELEDLYREWDTWA